MRPVAMVSLMFAMLAPGCAVRRIHVVGRYEPSAVVVSRAPPPVPPAVAAPPAPSPRYVWIPGYWGWSGRWTWVDAHWAPSRPDQVWTPPVAERLRDGRIAYHPGYWRPSSEAPPPVYAHSARVSVNRASPSVVRHVR